MLDPAALTRLESELGSAPGAPALFCRIRPSGVALISGQWPFAAPIRTRMISDTSLVTDQPMLYRVLAKTLHRPLHRALCHLDRALSADTHADLEV